MCIEKNARTARKNEPGGKIAMDEIQRSLRASLNADPGAVAREAFFEDLPKDPDALSFWISIAIALSEEDRWWYDTLIELARRYRQSLSGTERPEAPAVFLDWCVGVAAGAVKRPGQPGRPVKHMRDVLICAAVEAYRAPEAGSEPLVLGEACARVADAAALDESVVRKIWRRYGSGQ